MSLLHQIVTPAAVLDACVMRRNIQRMQQRIDALGVKLRPHVKTVKSVPIIAALVDAGAHGVTVSTLKEAEECFSAGITDILYAVGIAAVKLPQALALVHRGCALKLLTDNVDAARAVAEFGRRHAVTFEVWIEIDCDGKRAGLAPDDPALLDVARVLDAHDGRAGARLGGVMTHGGGSYALADRAALEDFAERERALCVAAADALRGDGHPCANVSVGSTPTALSARSEEGVTEVRAGVYVFNDLVMANIGVCGLPDIALSVLTTVIGHQRDKGWAIVDAGWMALSRDRGTASQAQDYGYGQVCTAAGVPVDGHVVVAANQEHGIVARAAGPAGNITQRFPIGTTLRILPNHACATAAQFGEYHVVERDEEPSSWPRFSGW